MKNKKFILKIFLSFFIFSFLSVPALALAGDKNEEKAIIFTPQVTIPGSIFEKEKGVEIQYSTTSIAEYVKAIYNYLLSIVGITAAIALMAGGIIWLTAGGSSEKVSQAKSWISGSLTGLTLALLSFVILQTINPQLVRFTATEVPKIEPARFGCCQFETQSGKVARDVTDIECYKIYTSKTVENINYVKKDALTPLSREGGEGTVQWADSVFKYLNRDGKERFSEEKKADYKTKTCREMIYCVMGVFWKPFLNNEFELVLDKIAIEMLREDCYVGMKDNSLQLIGFKGRTNPLIVTKEDLKDNDEVVSILRHQCAGREGKSCKDSRAMYCYCYGGKAYWNRGLQNEPCGNDGGICIPNTNTTGNKPLCDVKDAGGRSCAGGLKCCKPEGIHRSYDEGNNYGVSVDINVDGE